MKRAKLFSLLSCLLACVMGISSCGGPTSSDENLVIGNDITADFVHGDSEPDPTQGYTGEMIQRKTIAKFEYGTAMPYNRYTIKNPDANWQTRYWRSEQPEYLDYVPAASEEELKYASTTTWRDETEGGSNYWTIYPSAEGKTGVVRSDFLLYIRRDPAYEPDYSINFENTMDLSEYDQVSFVFKSTHSAGRKVSVKIYMYNRNSEALHLLSDCSLVSGRVTEIYCDISQMSAADKDSLEFFRFDVFSDLKQGETIRNDIYEIEAANRTTEKSTITVAGFEVDSEYLGTVLECPWGAYSASGFYDSEDGKWKLWFGASTAEILAADNIYYIETDDINGEWSKVYRIRLNDPEEILFPPDVNPGYGGDPSVLKIDGKYYMYFTALPQGLYEEYNGVTYSFWNKIYLATSNDGKNWDLYGEPIIDAYNSGRPLYYGAGGPSVIYKDGLFYMYYWTTSALEDDLTGLLLRTSEDGIHFGEATKIVTSNGGCDVKYIPEYDKWVMIFDYAEKCGLAVSEDGINFILQKEEFIAQNDTCILNHNPGLIGNEYGHGYTTMFAVYGVNDLPLAGTGSNMDARRLEWSRFTIDF